MLLGTLGAGLLGNFITGKKVMMAGKGTIRGGQNLKSNIKLTIIRLKIKTKFKIQKY